MDYATPASMLVKVSCTVEVEVIMLYGRKIFIPLWYGDVGTLPRQQHHAGNFAESYLLLYRNL
jgi:isopentenyl phosphate kinase